MERHTTSGKERRAVRAALHDEKPAIQVGKGGLEPAVIAAVDQALTAREAIKVRVGNSCPNEPREVAEALAIELHAEIIGITGSTILLFRPSPEND